MWRIIDQTRGINDIVRHPQKEIYRELNAQNVLSFLLSDSRIPINLKAFEERILQKNKKKTLIKQLHSTSYFLWLIESSEIF